MENARPDHVCGVVVGQVVLEHWTLDLEPHNVMMIFFPLQDTLSPKPRIEKKGYFHVFIHVLCTDNKPSVLGNVVNMFFLLHVVIPQKSNQNAVPVPTVYEHKMKYQGVI